MYYLLLARSPPQTTAITSHFCIYLLLSSLWRFIFGSSKVHFSTGLYVAILTRRYAIKPDEMMLV
jgi:hypothetical protein